MFEYRGDQPRPQNVSDPDSNPDRTLKAAGLKVLSREECEENFKKDIESPTVKDPILRKFVKMLLPTMMYSKEYEICMEGSEKSACTGDSGGPLICEGIV